MILDDILTHKRKDLEELKARYPLTRLREAVKRGRRTSHRSFRKAVLQPHRLSLICELKKASPSEGILRADFQPLRLANLFEYAGAAAISVLTEPHYFKGRASYLRTVREVTTIPLLRKDFIIDPYQLYESALLEADAFLLIASLLTENELQNFLKIGNELEMEALVEVHNEEDLKKALKAGAQIIGINNRNLRTLEVDPHLAKALLGHIPKNIPTVVESGLCRHEELMEYKSLGADAFLIGTYLMKSRDVVASIENLLGENKKWRRSAEEIA
jgi:indole-3-glycerol phosphate synthase